MKLKMEMKTKMKENTTVINTMVTTMVINTNKKNVSLKTLIFQIFTNNFSVFFKLVLTHIFLQFINFFLFS